jgi:hypothetical protein
MLAALPTLFCTIASGNLQTPFHTFGSESCNTR